MTPLRALDSCDDNVDDEPELLATDTPAAGAVLAGNDNFAYTHTHSLSLSVSVSYNHSQSLSLCVSLSLALSLSLSVCSVVLLDFIITNFNLCS